MSVRINLEVLTFIHIGKVEILWVKIVKFAEKYISNLFCNYLAVNGSDHVIFFVIFANYLFSSRLQALTSVVRRHGHKFFLKPIKCIRQVGMKN